MSKKTTQTYKFKKGQILSLDDIYTIQGLGNGDWWDKTGSDTDEYDPMGADMGEVIIITYDIEITIIVQKGAKQ